MADEVSRRAALDAIKGQPGVRRFLEAALDEGRISHAYLFVGAPGSGMEEAAIALAECVVCPQGGDDTCEDCHHVKCGTHLDVQVLRPASATGYVVEQARDLISRVQLAPARAKAKVFIVTQAERLRANTANALLKTIEEPPDDTHIILLARSTDAVLPTIVSRCQVLPFRVVSPDAAARDLAASAGVPEDEARIALAVGGSFERALTFLTEPAPEPLPKKFDPKRRSRRECRLIMMRALGGLLHGDSWDAIDGAAKVYEAVSGSSKERKELAERAEKDLKERYDEFLSAGPMRECVASWKRERDASERSSIMEVLAAAESLLRDALVACEGVAAPMVNVDQASLVSELAASSTPAGVLAALRRVRRAEGDLARNTSPQLALEAMLLSVKEDLTCPPSSR